MVAGAKVSEAERNYAQTESLVEFITKALDELPPRVLRFLLRLLRFRYDIVHVPGKHLITDMLSRAPAKHTFTQEEKDNETAPFRLFLPQKADWR